MKRLRELMDAGFIGHADSLNDFQKHWPEKHKGLVARIAREAFDDVIPRFHKVRGDLIDPCIYVYSGTEGSVGESIKLTSESRRFLMNYRMLIDYVAVSGWVRFTEQFTSAPKLHIKIEGTRVQRGTISQWVGALIQLQSGKCFYDETHELNVPEVDHVLPWSFVLEDKTWNLAAACRKCNNAKRDRLPGLSALEMLCSRNDRIQNGVLKTDSRFQRDFAEWHSRSFPPI